MEASTFAILTTDANNIYVDMDQSRANSASSSTLHVNHNGPFTLHYAIWPYVCLLSIIAIVWLSVYLSIVCARRRRLKSERDGVLSIYTTHDGIVDPGGASRTEASTFLSVSDV